MIDTDSCRILVVDDYEDAAESLQRLLDIHGYETRVAGDGEDAVRVCAELRPHVILMDIGLPKIDGHEATRRIRALRLEPRPLIVAMTGFDDDAFRHRSSEVGIDHHFVKPVSFLVLRQIIASSADQAGE